jgi:hypothetical protein
MPQALPSLRLIVGLQPPCQPANFNAINNLSENGKLLPKAKRTAWGLNPAKDSGLRRHGKYLLTIPTYLRSQGRVVSRSRDFWAERRHMPTRPTSRTEVIHGSQGETGGRRRRRRRKA